MDREFLRRRGDLLIAVGVALVLIVQESVLPGRLWLLAIPSSAVCSVGLAARRQRPLLCLIASFIGMGSLTLILGAVPDDVAASGTDGPIAAWRRLNLLSDTVMIVWLFAMFSVGAHASPRQLKIIAPLCGIGVAAATVIDITTAPARLGSTIDVPSFVAGDVSAAVLLVALPFGLGVGLRVYRAKRTEVRQLRVREEAARMALESEQARIARDLHDVISHSLAITLFQARGGRRVQASDPAAAKAAFDAIERTNEEALGDMRRMLGVLRKTPDTSESSTASTPTLRRLAGLVEVVGELGLTVTLDVHGNLAVIPPGVDLSAYRIVQEALTNVVRHAGAARAEVSVEAGDSQVSVTILDDGSGSADETGSGHGILGIKERVDVLGGTLEAHRREPAGFVVSAVLPYRLQP